MKHRHRYRALLFLTCCSALAACDNLETLEPNQCGNTVIERGEDCDGAGIGENACNELCRLECTASGACPAGWGCGADGVCRQPSSLFAPLGNTLPVSADDLRLADVDGDGRSDVVATRSGGVTIAFADAAGLAPGVTNIALSTIDADPEVPAIGDVDGDGRADLALRFGDSLGLLRGQQDRSLSPRIFSRKLAIAIGEDDHLVALDVDTRLESPGAEILAYGETGLRVAHSANDADFPEEPLLTWPKATPRHLGTYSIAVLYTFEGDSEVRLYVPFTQTAEDYVWNHDALANAETVAQLPGAATAKSPLFYTNLAIIDSSSMQTSNTQAFVVAGEESGQDKLFATFLGNGGFTSNPLLPEADDSFAEITPDGPAGVTEAPFGAVDLDGDGLIDLAGPRGFFTSACTPLFAGSQQCAVSFDPAAPSTKIAIDYELSRAPDAGDAWTGFHLAGRGLYDVDTGGYQDVLVTTAKPGFILYRNLGTPYVKTYRIPTSSPVKNVAIGDYNGDGSRDIAFSQVSRRRLPGGPALESIHIAFGDDLGLPTAPVDLGDAGEVAQVISTILFPTPSKKSAIVPEGDGVSDLIVRAKSDGKASTYVFAGSTDGQIQSPLDLASACPGDGAPSGVPRHSALAALSGEGARDLAVVYRRQSAGGEIEGYELWAVRPDSGDSESICASLVGPGELPDPGGTALSILPVDLDADGTEELLVFAAGSSKLFTAKIAAGAWSIETIDLGSAHRGITAAPVFATLPALSAPRDVLLWSDTGVTVLRNDGTGTLDADGAGTLSLEGLSCGAGQGEGPPASITGVAAVHLRPDESRELLVFTEQDVFVAEVRDAATGALGAPACAPFVLGGGGTAVTSGDVDGDGVEDVVIARPGGIQVLGGVPVVP